MNKELTYENVSMADAQAAEQFAVAYVAKVGVSKETMIDAVSTLRAIVATLTQQNDALREACKAIKALFDEEPRFYLRPIDHEYRMTYADSDRVDAAFIKLDAALTPEQQVKP